MDTNLLKLENEGQEIEYEIICPNEFGNAYRDKINRAINQLDGEFNSIQEQIDICNNEIDRLTNHADGLDYAIAVTSGIITGIIDSVFIGEWDFKNAKDVTNKKVNNMVVEFAKKDPRYLLWCKNTANGKKERDPNRLESAIEFLEKHYHLPGDSAYQTDNLGITGNSHRLDDFCHHPTLIGMICSVIVQFTGSTIYSPAGGEIIRIPIEVNQYGNFVGDNVFTKIMSGVINWFITCAKAISNQKGHLMSDIATPAGIPGSLLSTLKELSALPCFKDTMFSENLRKAYQNGIGKGKNQLDLGIFNHLFEGASNKFDKRTEMAVGHELKRQSIPIIINEALVRGFYFIRRFIEQIKAKKSIFEFDWKAVLPFKNRTIARMLTISTGTFMAFDIADAAIRSAVKNGGVNPATAKDFILRVNFVGIGRFAIAVGTDVAMGVKKAAKEKERIILMSQQLQLLNAKIYYKQADVWISAQDTGKAIEAASQTACRAIEFYVINWNEMKNELKSISDYVPRIEEKNPGLVKDLISILDEED